MTAAPQSTRDAMKAGADALFGLINAIDGAGYSTEFQRNLSRAASALSLLRSALEAREPAGWKLVPLELTDDMLNAGREAMHSRAPLYNGHSVLATWRAMLAASPVAAPVEARPVAWGVIDHAGKLLMAENRTLLAYFDKPPFPLYASPVAADTQGDAQELSGETVAQREEVCAAWADLPAALTCHPGMKRLYRALGGINRAAMTPPPSSVSPLGPGEDEYLSWVKELERGRTSAAAPFGMEPDDHEYDELGLPPQPDDANRLGGCVAGECGKGEKRG